jgi:glutamate-1-semialdehyde 2,1-aminomutase
MGVALIYLALGALALAVTLPRLKARLYLSLAKHPSLAGHSRLARRLAKHVPFYEYDEAGFFTSDDAPEEIAAMRRAGFQRLAAAFRVLFVETNRLTSLAEDGVSDLQFTMAHRVPFQYSRLVRENLRPGAFARSSSGVTVTDLDGNRSYDLTGSYGLNVFGYDFYKDCIDRGTERARSLGPVLGPYHPLLSENVERLRKVSGMDEVSFHMSGTEAVMQAVRLARFHTGRSHLVQFCGAYHGWWDDVQPGVGSPRPARDTYTLRDGSDASLRVLLTRRDVACVLVNPLQALHPNVASPGDATLVSSARRAHFDRAAYTRWLERLREVCTERGIVLIFDEVFVGFRLAAGGAQEYFGVPADIVTYGKTVGGGLPVGIVCGRKSLMRRFREDRPADVCFARGTFNSHPYVIASMNEFLRRLETPEIRGLYVGLDDLWNARALHLNRRLQDEGLPVRVSNLSSIWTICYTQPSRYNWMLQYYLRREGLALSWVGTGRLIFSLDYTDADFEAVVDRFMAACRAMRGDGWWWGHPGLSDKGIARRVLCEMAARLLRPAPTRIEGTLTTAHRGSGLSAHDRVEELPSEELEGRLVVEQDVMERIGHDLREPHQTRLNVLQEEQLHGPEEDGADTDAEPGDRRVSQEP